MIYFSELPEIIAGKIHKLYEDLPFEFLLTDSRKIFNPGLSLFFAIAGERHNGHKFIAEAYKAGVRLFVVTKYDPAYTQFEDAGFIEVANTIKALQNIAAFKRNHYLSMPVIAITGSNGKTIIKEWLTQLLSPDFSIVKSPKSYNSQVGVPLSVWQINERHTLGIFEAGISKTNEMENLEKVIQPTFGIFANIGSAHDEGFTSKDIKINEKLKLFKNVELLFYCADHIDIHEAVKNAAIPLFSWSLAHAADLKIRFMAIKGDKEVYVFKSALPAAYGEFILEVPVSDIGSKENLFHCIAIMAYFKIPPEEIQKRITLLKKISMRLELKQGINNCYLIDDTYNNDLAGLTIAIDFLKQQNQKPNKTLILSDLYETGIDNQTLYKNIASILKEKKIHTLIGIGTEISSSSKFFDGIQSTFYLNTKNFINSLHSHVFFNEIILVKGSRIFEFEKIVQQLQQKSHRTVLEINLDALSQNLNFYRSKLNPGTKIMVMVKSFAYGSGSLEVAQLLQFHRVDYLAVAYADEGVILRENGITIPVMVMNPSADTFDLMLNYHLEPVVYSVNELDVLIKYLNENSADMHVHLEIETGMHRLGIEEENISSAINKIKDSGRITVASVYSHLAGADEEEFHDYTQNQYGILLKTAASIEHTLQYRVIKHLLNSAGIVRYPELQLDMVRLGIGLYGVESNGLLQPYLTSVSTLKTTLSQIKKLKTGETVGYSRKGKLNRDTTIGIIAIGYGDGYSRSFSNGIGKVWVNGQLAPVIGNVCMDMTMIDLTGIKAKENDDVIIFGNEISIIDLAKSINTIAYEILTGVSERVKRIYFSE